MNHYFYDFELYQSPPKEIPLEKMEGDNEKKLLVVVGEEDFSLENKAFLSKILSAVQFEMDKDARVLILPKDQFYAVNSLLNGNKFDRCLLFGMNPKDLGFSIETYLYAPFEIANKNYLIGHHLEKIKDTTNLKKSLWGALQVLFKV